MKYKVHWIIDGLIDVDAKSKEDAEKKVQEELETYVKNSEKLNFKTIYLIIILILIIFSIHI